MPPVNLGKKPDQLVRFWREAVTSMGDPFFNPFPIDGIPVVVDPEVTGTERVVKSGRQYLVSSEWLDKVKLASPDELSAILENTGVVVLDDELSNPPVKLTVA